MKKFIESFLTNFVVGFAAGLAAITIVMWFKHIPVPTSTTRQFIWVTTGLTLGGVFAALPLGIGEFVCWACKRPDLRRYIGELGEVNAALTALPGIPTAAYWLWLVA